MFNMPERFPNIQPAGPLRASRERGPEFHPGEFRRNTCAAGSAP
jgi:hypothetical protein